MEKKFKIDFNEGNVQGSVAYILVSEFQLVPNILKAEIDGDGSGIMIVSVSGDKDKIEACVRKLGELGYIVSPLDSHILHNDDRCFSCGACTSQCPTKSIYLDKDTYELRIREDTCIACGCCIDACSVKALSLQL